MNGSFIVDDLLIVLRQLYLSENDIEIKNVWLHYGMKLKKNIEAGKIFPLDEVDDKFMSEFFST